MDIGCPEHSSEGVPSSWYALRVSYSRELKVQDKLNELGVKTFVPMMWRRCPVKPGMTTGNPSRRLVPAVGNLCFAYSTRAELEDFIRGYGETSPVHFYWDRTANKPLTVPEKAMNNFIAVSSTLDEDLIYITEITSKLREGQTVKVKEGPFKGIEGKVVRIRKSRRILVELPGMLAVATTYIQPEYLEII
jgi:transcription antitermination factor NusG